MKIQPDQIPESDITVIARSLIEGIQEYYRNPDNMAAFEQWEKEETSQCN